MCFRCYGNLFPYTCTYNGKSGNWHLFLVLLQIFCRYILLQIFWQKFYRNVLGVVLYQPYEFCPNRWFWLVAMATERLNFQNKYSKIFFSEAIRGMKLKLCINIYDISLLINYVFYCCCSCVLVAMATKSFHWFKMGKVKVFLSDYRYFDKSFTVISLSIWIKSKLLNLISCHSKWKAIFSCMQHLQYFGWI